MLMFQDTALETLKSHRQDFVPVEAVYIDPELDLAVLKVDIKDLPEISHEAELECSDTALNGMRLQHLAIHMV